MDNIQLAVLLRQYVARFDAAINDAEAGLPEEALEELSELNPSAFGGDAIYKKAPALDSLRELSKEIEKDIARLELAAGIPNPLTRANLKGQPHR